MSLKEAQRSKSADSKFKLRRILEITNAINENLSAEDLYEVFKTILQKDLEIAHFALVAYDNSEWQWVIREGIEESIENIDVEKELLPFHDITSLGMSDSAVLSYFDLLVPIFHKENPLGFVLLKEEEEETRRVSMLIKNLSFIQSLANIIMVAIENKRLAREELVQVGIKRELELAERIQKALLPSKLPNNEQLKASAYHESHGHVGGDYYDLLETSPGVFYFCMADISGKGVSAALLMSNFQAAFKATVRQNLSLRSIVQQLNDIVVESSRGESFITVFLGKYDTFTKELEYVNCAHPPAILYNSKMTRELGATIPGLGMLEELPAYRPETYTLSPNTCITCYTDGVNEFENSEGEQYGTERLVKCINQAKEGEFENLNEAILKDIEEFVAGEQATDDIAMLNIEFH